MNIEILVYLFFSNTYYFLKIMLFRIASVRMTKDTNYK